VLEAPKVRGIVEQFYKDSLLLLETRGLLDLISAVKTARNQIMNYSLGTPMIGPGLDSEGFPKKFGYLKDLTTSANGLRAVLTLLTLTRAFTHRAEPDLLSIEKCWEGTDNITQQELNLVLRLLKVRKGSVGEWNFPHISTKKGPQGQALLSSLSELTLLSPTQVEYISLLGGKGLSKMIDENLMALDVLEFIKPKGILGYFSVSRWWKTIFPTKSSNLRKLSYFPDKEGKTRVIAIFDYWSQSALKPLHLKIFQVLRNIKTDYTFDQNRFTSTLPKAPLGHFHSIDLTAATDRMPIALQKRVVEFLYGCPAKAMAWEQLMVGSNFTVVMPDKSIKTVSYGAGQPMGAYSSWAVMALTHHLLVQVAALRAGVLKINSGSAFTQYALLGDDLRIDHDLVASEYLNLISSLDMPYSPAKTHVSKHGFEFAKRWYCLGQEVTGFSVSGLMSVWKSYPLLLNFLDNQETHGWTLSKSGHPGLIRSIHREFHGDSYIINKTDSMVNLYVLFNQVRLLKSQSNIMWANAVPALKEALVPYSLGDTLDAWISKVTDPQVAINLVYLRAKRNLVEKDLYSFQKQAYIVNAKLWKYVNDKIKEASADQATRAFLKETLSVILNWNHPIVLVLNRQIDKATEFLMNYWDPEISDSFLFEAGLSKYNLTKGVFSMRSVTSIVLSESAILKEFIKVLKNLEVETSEDFKALNERLTMETQQ